MVDQNQKVGKGSTAIQSGGHTIIKQGLSAADMRHILDALAAQFPAQLAAAKQIVDVRLADFERRILEKFEDARDANPDAFADPDFQYVVRSSQHAYARLGDEGVRDVLIDLIAHRSKQQERNRLSLTLNEAVEKAALLTKNEFAELSLCYLLKYTINNRIGNLETFSHYFREYISPLLPDISKENASYQYLEAQSCGNLSLGAIRTAGHDAIQIFRLNYGGIFSNGLDRPLLESHLPDGKKDAVDKIGLIIPCLNDPNKLQLKAINKETFLKEAASSGLNESELTNVWNMFESTFWNGEEFLSKVEKHVPEIRELIELWNKSGIANLNLTTVGIAIGHSNLVRIAKLDADLGIWIK